jgi:aspartyl protease
VTGGRFLQLIQLIPACKLREKQLTAAMPASSLRALLFSFWQRIIIAMLATCSLLSSPELTPAAFSEPSKTTSSSQAPTAIWIYSAPDEASLRLGTLAPSETATPIGETQAAGGARWFLIKSKTAITGWIKQSENDQAKKIDSFFKSQPVENSNVPAAIPNLSSAAAPRGTMFVPVLTADRSAIVAGTLNRTITANLMLDTGATHTVISQRLAGILSLRPAGRSAVQTVGGVIAVTVSRLRSLRVGEAEVNDLPIIVHDFARDPRIDGLLGMDFLARYRFGLDGQRQVLVLSPR